MKNNFYESARQEFNNAKIRFSSLRHRFVDPAPKLIVLAYHRVIPEVGSDPFKIAVSKETFCKQLDFLKKKYPIISLGEAVAQFKSGDIKSKIQVALTFDDGCEDSHKIIFPILRQNGLKATFFVVTDYVANQKPLWYSDSFEILYNNPNIEAVELEGKLLRRGFMQSRVSFIFSIIEKMKSMVSRQRTETIDLLKSQSKENTYSFDKCLNWQQVREMSDSGMEIGSHSLSHGSLARIPKEEARQEIKKSKELIEENIKKRCLHFAFPCGSKKDFNQNLVDYVRDVGYQTCLLNVHGYNRIKKDTFCLKRIIVEETTNLNYLPG